MARFSSSLVLLVILISTIVLIIDSKTEQGVLNMVGEKKPIDVDEQQDRMKEASNDSAHSVQEPPTTEKSRQQAVPANKREEQPANDSKAPFIVCIDPGHQAKGNSDQEPIGSGATETKDKVTSGTLGVETRKPEYILNLEAGNILKELLEKEGIQVIMTRISHDVDISNRERAEVANQAHADLFIRVHADGSENPNTNGFSVLVPAQNNPYTKNIYENSNQAGQLIVNRVSESNYPILGSGLFPREDLSGFNWSQVPVILLELGFMTNPDEDRRLSDESYLSGLLKEVAHGISDYRNEHR